MERRAFFRWNFVLTERRRRNRLWAVVMVLSIPAFLLCERHIVSSGRVTDVSMEPTLDPGSYFLINKYLYHFRPPKRGDVVVIQPATHRRWYYVKRVIGLGGEELEIRDGQVFVNGKRLEEPYVNGLTYPDMTRRRIPELSYFLMGDNRPNSEDSRTFGSVPLERIEGKIKPGKLLSFR